MRATDPPDVEAKYREMRAQAEKAEKKQSASRTLLGFLLVLAGIAGVAAPYFVEIERARELGIVGILILLLGGVMVSADGVSAWFEMFGKFLPWGKGNA